MTCGFALPRPAPSRHPRAVIHGSRPARRRARARARTPPGRRIFSSCPCSPPSLPLARRPLVAGRTRFRPSGKGSLADHRGLAGSPVPFARRPGARSGLRSLRARLLDEVPGFGAVLIARFGSRHDWRRPSRGSPLGVRAGGRWRGSCRPRMPARDQAVDRRHVFGLEGGESGELWGRAGQEFGQEFVAQARPQGMRDGRASTPRDSSGMGPGRDRPRRHAASGIQACIRPRSLLAAKAVGRPHVFCLVESIACAPMPGNLAPRLRPAVVTRCECLSDRPANRSTDRPTRRQSLPGTEPTDRVTAQLTARRIARLNAEYRRWIDAEGRRHKLGACAGSVQTDPLPVTQTTCGVSGSGVSSPQNGRLAAREDAAGAQHVRGEVCERFEI